MAEPLAAGVSPVPQALRHPPMRSVKALTLVRRRRGEPPVTADCTDARAETALPGSAKRRLTVLLMPGILQRLPVPAMPHDAPSPATRHATKNRRTRTAQTKVRLPHPIG